MFPLTAISLTRLSPTETQKQRRDADPHTRAAYIDKTFETCRREEVVLDRGHVSHGRKKMEGRKTEGKKEMPGIEQN